jgi:hypothetical protein
MIHYVFGFLQKIVTITIELYDYDGEREITQDYYYYNKQ